MVTGYLVTSWLVPETKGKSLEDLSNENQPGFVGGYAYDLQAIELQPLVRFPFKPQAPEVPE